MRSTALIAAVITIMPIGVSAEERRIGITHRASVAYDDLETDGSTLGGSISDDGRYAAFRSRATNLVEADGNGVSDVFRRDLIARTTSIASISTGGGQGDGWSDDPSISGDGAVIAFTSVARDLSPQDGDPVADVFVRDFGSGETTLVSISSSGAKGTRPSDTPVISRDGRYVAFESASALVPNDTNGWNDVYRHDRSTGETMRVSVSSSGEQSNGPSYMLDMSADGQHVVFDSYGSNLDGLPWPGAFVRDIASGTTERTMGGGPETTISDDGRMVAFWTPWELLPEDTNDASDVYVYDRELDIVTRASVSSSGAQASVGSTGAFISGDGRWVLFDSGASNFAAGDYDGTRDAFVHDLRDRTTRIVSVSTLGVGMDIPRIGQSEFDPSVGTSISRDGCHVSMSSLSRTLTPADLNFTWDVFTRELCVLPQ